ncbi:MAG: haloacid dehalogenase type II, partial [Chloroflexia bacterium]|nr:haloacid dehalogenase type II [Chloroflexia bacterium]
MSTVIAFDVYGTLVDPLAITTALEHWCGAQSQLVATTWRQRQLEYTWRRSAMGRYVDFAVVTAQALQVALTQARCYVSSADQQQLCQ